VLAFQQLAVAAFWSGRGVFPFRTLFVQVLAFQQLAVAAFWSERGVFPFRTLFVQVPSSAP
jgi:hypothetical protein